MAQGETLQGGNGGWDRDGKREGPGRPRPQVPPGEGAIWPVGQECACSDTLLCAQHCLELYVCYLSSSPASS